MIFVDIERRDIDGYEHGPINSLNGIGDRPTYTDTFF